MSLSSPASRYLPQNSAWHYLPRLQTRSRTCMLSSFIVKSTTSTSRVRTSAGIHVSQSRFANPLHWSNGPGKCLWQYPRNCGSLRHLHFSRSTTHSHFCPALDYHSTKPHCLQPMHSVVQQFFPTTCYHIVCLWPVVLCS